MTRAYTHITEVIANDMCIGCGLCESVASGRVCMQLTPAGSLRSNTIDAFSEEEHNTLMSACPGIQVSPRNHDTSNLDIVWGRYHTMQYAWAADAKVRYEGATGGVLTALGSHLLNAGLTHFNSRIAFIAGGSNRTPSFDPKVVIVEVNEP